MPLQGQLGHIGLADVLQTALAGSRGGELTVLRGAERAILHLTNEGLFLIEPEVLDAEDVLNAFASRGQLPGEAVHALNGNRPNAQALLDGLLTDGTLDQGQILQIVADSVEDAVLTMLTWHEGTFRFQEGVPASARTGLVANVSVDLEGVLVRAAQRMDERRMLEQSVGAYPVLFRGLDAQLPPSDPSERLDEVHAALDGSATVGEIALRMGTSRFGLLRTVATLVDAGAARSATPEELQSALDQRLNGKRLRVAREIAMQWATEHPEDPDGPRALVRVAEARERPVEVASAFTLLGDRLFARGEHAAAVSAYQDALSGRPGDATALQGLRTAAEAAGDPGLWASTTLRLGQTMLDEEDPTRARALAVEVLARTPDDINARLLELRGCVGQKDSEGLVAGATALVEQLGDKAAKRVEREAADFCRGAIALLAPDRSDLLRQLRRLTDNPKGRRRRVALVGALLAIVGTGGVVLWPVSAGSLLGKARVAAEAGDTSEALALAEQIIERFPESAEAAEAFALQTQLVPQPSRPSGQQPTNQRKEELRGAVPALQAALLELPAEAARSAVVAQQATLLKGPKSEVLPREVPDALIRTLNRLSVDARGRRDTLGLAKTGRDRPKTDAPTLRALLDQMQAARDLTHLAALKSSLAALQPYIDGLDHELLRRAGRELASELGLLERAIGSLDAAVIDIRRRVLQLEIEAVHAACREQGARLMVGGRLHEADALYKDLEQRLALVAADPTLVGLRDLLERMNIPDFVRERRALVAEVFAGLEAARAAAEAGDLPAAAAAYHALAQRHYTIRFDDLVHIPLQVDTVPSGAEVSLNGKLLGTTPLRMDYPWGGPTTISLAAPGFDPHVTILDTNKDKPIVTLSARLAPSTVWRAKVSGHVEARPLDLGGDLLVCDRAGRITRFAGDDGRTLWSRHLKSLEGMRGRPTTVTGGILAAFLDGRVALLDPRDGELLAEHQIARPVGDLASHEDVAAVAVGTPALVGLRATGTVWTTPLPAHLSAGVLSAHAAFWLGLADGSVLRVEPRTGAAKRLPLPDLQGPVTGIAASATGVLVVSSGGLVACLAPDGSARWVSQNHGDLLGAPAETARRVVVTDRKGTMIFLDARDGSPVHQVALGREAVGGILAHGDCVAAVLSDGRLWVYDARTLTPVAEAQLSGKGLGPATTIGKGKLAVVTRDGQVLALPFVSAPRTAPEAPR